MLSWRLCEMKDIQELLLFFWLSFGKIRLWFHSLEACCLQIGELVVLFIFLPWLYCWSFIRLRTFWYFHKPLVLVKTTEKYSAAFVGFIFGCLITCLLTWVLWTSGPAEDKAGENVARRRLQVGKGYGTPLSHDNVINLVCHWTKLVAA